MFGYITAMSGYGQAPMSRIMQIAPGKPIFTDVVLLRILNKKPTL